MRYLTSDEVGAVRWVAGEALIAEGNPDSEYYRLDWWYFDHCAQRDFIEGTLEEVKTEATRFAESKGWDTAGGYWMQHRRSDSWEKDYFDPKLDLLKGDLLGPTAFIHKCKSPLHS